MRPVVLTYDPPVMPHVCLKCKAHTQIRDWFVDIGTETEWEGYVYLCNSCLSDIVRVTPDFLSVDAHREIVAEYMARMDELTELKQRFNMMSAMWMDMTGNSLEIFMDNLAKVNEYARLELSRTVLGSTGSDTTIVSNSSESERDNRESDESEPLVIPNVEFA